VKHVAYFGDGEKTFALTDPMTIELERILGFGIGAIMQRFTTRVFNLRDIAETIRLGLIGGGEAPQVASAFISAYVDNRPIAETLPIAIGILTARYFGDEPEGQDDAEPDEIDHAAATGNLAAAIKAAYADVADV
jgi:hypothetical protein